MKTTRFLFRLRCSSALVPLPHASRWRAPRPLCRSGVWASPRLSHLLLPFCTIYSKASSLSEWRCLRKQAKYFPAPSKVSQVTYDLHATTELAFCSRCKGRQLIVIACWDISNHIVTCVLSCSTCHMFTFHADTDQRKGSVRAGASETEDYFLESLSKADRQVNIIQGECMCPEKTDDGLKGIQFSTKRRNANQRAQSAAMPRTGRRNHV